MDCEFFGPTDDRAKLWAKWVAERIPYAQRGWGTCSVMRVHRDAETLGCAVFHDWNPEAGVIAFSAAADRPIWLNRKVIRAGHNFAFLIMRCQLLVMQVSEFNLPANSMAERLGYTPHLIPRLLGRDHDQIVWTLTIEQWQASPYRR